MYLGVISSEQQAQLNLMEADIKRACDESRGHFPWTPILLGGAIGALVKKSNRADGATTGALYGLLVGVALKATVSYGCKYIPERIAEFRKRGGV